MDDELFGAPDLVIEILSPSNSAKKMLDREKICLENGAKEFWVIDPDARLVQITTNNGRVARYGPGDTIQIELFDRAELRVDDIFG